jgi:hypothetical protein
MAERPYEQLFMNYSAIPRDTSREAFWVQVDVMRRLGIEGRAKLTFRLCDNLRRVLAEGVRHRHPGYTDDQVRLAVIRLRLGDALFRKAYPAVDIEP